MKIAPNTQTLLAGAAVVFLAAWYLQSKLSNGGRILADAAGTVAPYINPADPNNIMYSGIGAVGTVISGDYDWSLGTWLYDVSH